MGAQTLSVDMTVPIKLAGSALHNSPLRLEDASCFSGHTRIYHLLSPQAWFLMIRIIHTSFTFTDWLLFPSAKHFLQTPCSSSVFIPLPASLRPSRPP